MTSPATIPDAFSLSSIGWVSSVFKEKFGTPRQSGVVPSATGELHFHPPYDQPEAFQEISSFSHLWLISIFHLIPEERVFHPRVRPPKLGGEKKVGVFASRAPYRPNRLCLSVVKLEEVREQAGKVSLRVSGLDLVDGTPLLDVKPYLPYADAHPGAEDGFGLIPREVLPVQPERAEIFSGLSAEEERLITETLQARPEPAYARPEQGFGLTLGEMNVSWVVEDNIILVKEVFKKKD